jgi:hypothetical protein
VIVSLFFYWLLNPLEPSPCLEVDNHSAGQEIPPFLEPTVFLEDIVRKYGDLALQVGRVSDETVRPVSDCTKNYRPIVSSERAPYMKKKESTCQTSEN